ncbi:MAG: hypothetical protein H6Q89_1103 [Myxococcaceae bacterium]|nr:hypothetical protein [Myxococcaceae bacterium]
MKEQTWRAVPLALLLATLASPARAEGEAGSIAGEVAAPSPRLRAGVVVYLEKVAGPFRPPAEPAVIDQQGMKFVPRVLSILRGTTVAFRNSDPVRHNVFTPDAEKYNLGTWPTGESRTHVFAKSGVYRQLCAVHPEMEAFVIVLDNPFFAVTDADGKFRIEKVPPGGYTLKTWGEKLAPGSAPITVQAGQVAAAKIALARP